MQMKRKYILKEESGSQRRACEQNIAQYCTPMLRRFLDTPLLELPDYIKDQLSTGAAEHMFNAVANNQNGSNKLIDFLRINLYNDFFIKRNCKIAKYLKGISRLICGECGYYSFSQQELKGGWIVKIRQILMILEYTFTPQQLEQLGLDNDFNGMNYHQFIEFFSDMVSNYKNRIETELRTGLLNGQCDYDIIKVPDTLTSFGMGHVATPTPQGRQFLNALSNYTTWCICDPRIGDMEYQQYTQCGGAFYICLKRGFREIQRPNIEGEENHSALDEYGLSMISVIVGTDGYPENITTRWNHEIGGENNQDLYNAAQLQRILNVSYKNTFKPRGREELQQMNLTENKKTNINKMSNKRIMSESDVAKLVREAALKSMKLMSEEKEKPTKKIMTMAQLTEFVNEATVRALKRILKEDDFTDYEDDGYFNNFDNDDIEDADFEEMNPTDNTQVEGDDEVERNIIDGCNPMVSRYLNTPLSELPEQFTEVFGQAPIFDQLEARGVNLMEFLKQYMLEQLGISENSPLAHMLPGISRILSQDCGFFSFDPSQTNIQNIMSFINHLKSSAAAQGGLDGFDSDLNGMSCQEVINAITQRVRHDDNAQFNFDDFLNGSANVLRHGEGQ